MPLVAKKVCPSGWHLPTQEEFKALFASAGENEREQSANLRAYSYNHGLDKYLFGALAAGGYLSGLNSYNLAYAEFWTSSMMNSSLGLKLPVYLTIYETYFFFGGHETTLTTDAYSVRCIKD